MKKDCVACVTETLRYVVSQRLIGKVGGGRLMVSEIMGSSLRTREVISLGETDGRSLQEIIEVSAAKGWHSFDQSLLKAYGDSLITEETALLYCNSKSGLGQKIDKLKQSRGVKDESPINLRLSASPLGKTPGT